MAHTRLAKRREKGTGFIIMGILFILLPIINPFNVPLEHWKIYIAIIGGSILLIMGVWDRTCLFVKKGENYFFSLVTKEMDMNGNELFLGYYTEEEFEKLSIPGTSKRMGMFSKKGKFRVYLSFLDE